MAKEKVISKAQKDYLLSEIKRLEEDSRHKVSSLYASLGNEIFHYDRMKYLEKPIERKKNVKRDYTKYVFNDVAYSKSRLVIETVKYAVRQKKIVHIDDFLEYFPAELFDYFTVIERKDLIKEGNFSSYSDNYDDVIVLDNKEYLIYKKYDKKNILKYIANIEEKLGYQISIKEEA